jgi:NADP-dependent 3-hydroxy acid dehydrogenase YdfG
MSANLARGRLAGRLALVTGASAGIGRATAVALAREGAAIIATGRREAELATLAAECVAAGGSARPLAGDLNDPAFLATLAAAAAAADIFVNNAGVLTYAPLLELTDAQCAAMFQVNVLAALRISQAIGAAMSARRRGHIVIMTSLSARNINRFAVVYGATKHAMSGIAKGLRLELKPFGIKVTEIAPGMVDTEIRDASTHPEVVAQLKSRSYPPLTPEDVAESVIYAVCTSANCCPDLIELRPSQA